MSKLEFKTIDCLLNDLNNNTFVNDLANLLAKDWYIFNSFIVDLKFVLILARKKINRQGD